MCVYLSVYVRGCVRIQQNGMCVCLVTRCTRQIDHVCQPTTRNFKLPKQHIKLQGKGLQ